MISGAAGPFDRDDGAFSSWPKGKKVGGGQSSAESYPNKKKNLSYDSIAVCNAIYKHAMVINDYEIVDGLLGCLEAQWWLSTFSCSKLKVTMTLIAEFYHSMDQSNLSYV